MRTRAADCVPWLRAACQVRPDQLAGLVSPAMGPPLVRARPRRGDPHEVAYFRRHRDDDPAQAVPGREFLGSCPAGVRAKFRAVLVAVAAAPPHRFAGGGYWKRCTET